MIDSHTDKSKFLIQGVSLRIGSNDFFKVASHVAESANATSVTDFADRDNKLYPCHTKEATLVNFAYFTEQISAYDKQTAAKIADRFAEKIAFWNLEDAVEEVIDGIRKTEPIKYAMEIGTEKLFPYADGASLVKAASAFCASKHKFPYASRTKTAKHLLKTASKLGVELSNDVVRYLEKAAGWAVADLDEMVASVRRRAHDDRFKKHASALEQIANTLPYFESNTEALFDTEKVASFISALEAYDVATGRSRDYAFSGVPEERIYADVNLEKVAEELKNTVRLTNGVTVTVDKELLSKIAAVDPQLGKDIGDSVEKAVDILPTLPKPDADYITEACI